MNGTNAMILSSPSNEAKKDEISTGSKFESFHKRETDDVVEVIDEYGKVVEYGHNRHRRKEGVKHYCSVMNAGDWILDRGQVPIMFDVDGNMRSGQHRMEAFRLSELEQISFLVLRDATEDEIRRQDSGINRNFTDHLTMYQDMPQLKRIPPGKVSTVCRALHDVLEPEEEETPATVSRIARKYSPSLEKADALVLVKGSRMQKHAPVLAAFLWAADRMDPTKWEETFIQFDQGINIQANSTIHRLVKLTEEGTASRRTQPLFEKTICALRQLHLNKPSTYLTGGKKHMEGW